MRRRVPVNPKQHVPEIEDDFLTYKSDLEKQLENDIPFYLPDKIITEEDLMDIKDISVPNSLALNQSVNIQPSKYITEVPKYQPGEKVVFIDPATRKEAYGKITSEYDLRGGTSAPPIIRGENHEVKYKIEKINNLDQENENRYYEIVDTPPEEIEAVEYPKLNGLQDATLREAYRRKALIEKRLEDWNNKK